MSRSLSTIRRSIVPLAASCTLAAGALTAVAAPHASAGVATFPAATSARIAQGSVAVELVNENGKGRPQIMSVTPTGAKTVVANLVGSEIVLDVSADGRRLVTRTWDGTPTVRVYDLATHRVTSFQRAISRAHFTNPTGANLLISAYDSAPVTRVSFTGRTLATYQGAKGENFVPSADGRYLYGVNKGAITLSGNASGALIRTFAKPRGFDYCTPTRNWDNTSVVANCVSNARVLSQMFRFRATGGPAVAITSSLAKQQFGYVDAWKSNQGTVVSLGVGCGAAPSALVRNGKLVTLPLEPMVDVRGDLAYGLRNADCGGPSDVSLDAVNLKTMKLSTLLDPTKYPNKFISVARVNDPLQGA